MALKFSWIDVLIIFLYLAALSGIGFYFSRKQSSLNEFFRAGRRMGWLPIGMSLMAALNSGIDYLMQPSAVIKYGAVVLVGITSWLFLYPWVAWVTGPFFRYLDVYTAYEYLERRFDVRVRTLAATIFILWRLGWMATAMYVPCLAINAASGGAIPLAPMIILLGAIVTTYTTLGGIKAVIWTDVTQFCIMFGGLAVTVGIVLNSVPGGLGEIFTTAHSAGKLSLAAQLKEPPAAGILDGLLRFLKEPVTAIGMIAAALVGRMALYTSDQVMVQRFQTTRSLKDTRQSFVINALGDTIWMLGLGFVGLSLLAYYGPGQLPTGDATDKIFPSFMAQHFPSGAVGLVVAAIFAASLSSIDSAINSCTSVAMVDLYGRLRLGRDVTRAAASEHEQRLQVRASRIFNVVFGTAGVLLSLNVSRLGDLIEIANKVIQSFTGPIFGIFVIGMFCSSARSTAVLVGGIVGAMVSMYVAFLSPLSFLWPSVFGFVATLVAGLVLSPLCGAPGAGQQGLTFRNVLRQFRNQETTQPSS